MIWLQWLALAAVLFAAASVGALWSYGRFARKARGAPSDAIPPGADAPLDRAIGALEAAHPRETGASLVIDNRAAFTDRLHTIRAAQRSLDMLYYIWRDDLTGRLLVHELLAAADRGVRVRVLLDDVNTLGFDPGYLGLNGHPGIEVRLFNPVTTRRNAVRRGLALLLALVRYNRRMHCKAWLADGRLAIIGGRNIGDVYFDATRSWRRRNCRDADLVLAGPVVVEAARVFDSYWNSGLALPIAAMWSDYKADLPRYRARLQALARSARARAYLRRLDGIEEAGDSAAARLAQHPFRWSASARLVSDPPEKATGNGRDSWMPAALQPVLSGADRQVALISPYLVPGREGMATLTALAARGVHVSVLT
jgi:cardiolipin synthase C